MTANGVFETSSRKLEQFLFIHDIRHSGWRKDDDGMTVWQYPDTDEVNHVVTEFREIMTRRKLREERRN